MREYYMKEDLEMAEVIEQYIISVFILCTIGLLMWNYLKSRKCREE